MDDDDTDIAVPIDLRSHEVEQLQREFGPQLLASCDDRGVNYELIDTTLRQIETSVGRDGRVFLKTHKWWTLITELGNLDGNKAEYLQRKLARRVRDRVAELG